MFLEWNNAPLSLITIPSMFDKWGAMLYIIQIYIVVSIITLYIKIITLLSFINY